VCVTAVEMAATDLRISNVVDVPNYVVSALLQEDIFQS
jgi:acetamidase/formamidase